MYNLFALVRVFVFGVCKLVSLRELFTFSFFVVSS
nr:MAG TPA: hypothetical protein [Caudoviricetes sp.]